MKLLYSSSVSFGLGLRADMATIAKEEIPDVVRGPIHQALVPIVEQVDAWDDAVKREAFTEVNWEKQP